MMGHSCMAMVFACASTALAGAGDEHRAKPTRKQSVPGLGGSPGRQRVGLGAVPPLGWSTWCVSLCITHRPVALARQPVASSNVPNDVLIVGIVATPERAAIQHAVG